MATLIDSLACQVRHSPDGLQAVLRRRTGSIIGSCLLLAFGGASIGIAGMMVWTEGPLVLGLGLALGGLAFVALALTYLSSLKRYWGEVSVTAVEVRWQRGTHQVGVWPLDHVTGLTQTLALNTSLRFGERILSLTMRDGTTVRLAVGTSHELDQVRRALTALDVAT
jgi:hypothetical protein